MSPILSNKKYVLYILNHENFLESCGEIDVSLNQGLNILILIFFGEEYNSLEKEIRLKFWKFLGEDKIYIERIPEITMFKYVQNVQFSVDCLNNKNDDKVF